MCKRAPLPTLQRQPRLNAGVVLGLTATALGLVAIGYEHWDRAKRPGERATAVRGLKPHSEDRAESMRQEPPGEANPTSQTASARAIERAANDAEHLVLTEDDPESSVQELRARGVSEVEGEFRVAGESYELWAPAPDNSPFGVLVWISAGSSGALENPEWKPALIQHRLIWIGPNNAQNGRADGARMALAVNAVKAARAHHAIDEERVYIGGMSGGAKSAFHTLLAFPDIFRGALLACGIEYYRDIPARSAGTGKTWFKRMNQPRELAAAKSRSIIVVTGSNDFNFGQITDVISAMHDDGFINAQILNVPGLGHQRPPAEAFGAALQQLATR